MSLMWNRNIVTVIVAVANVCWYAFGPDMTNGFWDPSELSNDFAFEGVVTISLPSVGVADFSSSWICEKSLILIPQNLCVSVASFHVTLPYN